MSREKGNLKFPMCELVPATVYHASLVGMKAPAPGFGRKISAPKLGAGLVHKDLKWPFICTCCGQEGHNINECGFEGRLPQIVQRPGQQEKIVTPQKLYAMGVVNADGEKIGG